MGTAAEPAQPPRPPARRGISQRLRSASPLSVPELEGRHVVVRFPPYHARMDRRLAHAGGTSNEPAWRRALVLRRDDQLARVRRITRTAAVATVAAVGALALYVSRALPGHAATPTPAAGSATAAGSSQAAASQSTAGSAGTPSASASVGSATTLAPPQAPPVRTTRPAPVTSGAS